MAERRYSGTHYVPGMTEAQAHRAAQLEVPVLIAVLATIPILILVSQDYGGTLGDVADVLNWAVWVMFVIEALIMLRIAPDNLAWARRNVLDILIIVLTPPFLPESLQFLWVLRLLRILDLMPVIIRIFRLNAFAYAAMVAFIAVLGGGLAYGEIEEGRGVTEWDGVWWAMTTISTTGYGDQFPTSPGGRVLGMTIMLMGPILIGLVATGVGAMVMREIQEDLEEVMEAAGDQIEELELAVDEVEEDVAGLSATDRLVLKRLDEISKRLDGLERGG